MPASRLTKAVRQSVKQGGKLGVDEASGPSRSINYRLPREYHLGIIYVEHPMRSHAPEPLEKQKTPEKEQRQTLPTSKESECTPPTNPHLRWHPLLHEK